MPARRFGSISEPELSANIWLNGKQMRFGRRGRGLADLEFDITARQNRVLPMRWPCKLGAEKDDLAITFVDWNPNPPAKNMGPLAQGLRDDFRPVPYAIRR